MEKQKALEILRRYKNEHSDEYGILKIGIFGSVARDEATENSDVDIVVETETPNLFNLVHIKESLEALYHTHVDIVRYRETMNPYLKKYIEQEAIYV